MSVSTPYKPSPLSFGSPRTSPFRRPESPASPSTTIRPTPPATSSTKPCTPLQSPSKLHNVSLNSPTASSNDDRWTSRGPDPSDDRNITHPPSPTHNARNYGTARDNVTILGASGTRAMNVDTLSKVPPAQVRSMREAFQILDRDSDGFVSRDDIVDILTNLGQPAQPGSLGYFFDPATPQPLPLPTFLSTLSSLLAPLSSRDELLNAFAAFDDDDSGQVNINELRDSLLSTVPEKGQASMGVKEVDEVLCAFIGKRTFAKGAVGRARDDVFRYRDFVGSVSGGGEGEPGEEKKT